MIIIVIMIITSTVIDAAVILQGRQQNAPRNHLTEHHQLADEQKRIIYLLVMNKTPM